MSRNLTNAEILLLKGVFWNTLRYGSIQCDVNEMNVGGYHNSITPSGVAHFSKAIYCDDFSGANHYDQRIFVHEMMHVWQWGHGVYPVNAAIGIFFQFGGNYGNAYAYDLVAGKALRDYNLEQQAALVADYWGLVTNKILPEYSNSKSVKAAEYDALIDEVRKAGPHRSKLEQSPY